MSHRKVCSQGNIPFSWEDKPGISKLITTKKQGCPIDQRPQALDEHSSSKQQPPHKDLSNDDMKMKSNNIPLPPCPASSRPPSRSSSGKGLKWQLQDQQEDPFLLAYKECTKPTKNSKSQLVDRNLHQYKNKKGSKANKKSMFNMYFSCKSVNSCDVNITRNDNNDNNFMKLNNPKLPALPRYKLQDIMRDNW